MVIDSIFPPYIYSIHYDAEEDNEYDRLFDAWNDPEYVTGFMCDNQDYLQSDTWIQIQNPEDAAKQVMSEAEELENQFEALADNSDNGTKPDFDSLFHYLEGKYKYELEIAAMKSYGPYRPSLLRMYAIRMKPNCYLITGGGIKLAKKIQDSPELKDHALQNIDRVKDYLLRNGISDSNDI